MSGRQGTGLTETISGCCGSPGGSLHALAMSLEEYRLAVVEELKACTDPLRSRELLAQVDAYLGATAMSDGAQKAFWQSLNHDLNIIAHQMSRPLERHVVRARAAIAAAQAAIAQYQRQLRSDGHAHET
jgi:hypothetical protein